METNSIDRLIQALEQSQRVCAQMMQTTDRLVKRLDEAIARLEQ